MNNLIKSRKTWIIVGAVLVVLIIILLILQNRFKKEVEEPPFGVRKTDINVASVPEGFPVNLPSELGSKVLQNFETKSTDGRVQSTREVTSKKDPVSIVRTYLDFFKSIGYDILLDTTTNSKSDTQTVLVRKGKANISIVASPYRDIRDSKIKSKVNLTLIYQP